jgi:hypothetical protein
VHRTHDDAIRQARETQIERGKQARVLHADGIPVRAVSA